MKILVVGANGYAGARIYEDLGRGFEVHGTYHGAKVWPELMKLDAARPGESKRLAIGMGPDFIVNATGLANPGFCEEHRAAAELINVGVVRNLIGAANASGATLVHLSTVEVLAKNGVYSATKLKAEGEVIGKAKSYVILRPSLIVGSSPNTENDRYHNRLLKAVINGESPAYDNSLRTQVTWIGHISEVIGRAIKGGLRGEILPVAVPERHTRYEISADILKAFGVHCSASDNPSTKMEAYQDVSRLKELGLPTYGYAAVVEKVVGELREQVRRAKG